MAETPPVDFSGTWNLTRNENWDEYSAAIGMPWIARKMAGKASPCMTVVQTGNHFHITMSTMMMTRVSEFTVGEEFIFEPPKSGQKLKSMARWEGDKLYVHATPENLEENNMVEQTTIRELNGPDETIVTAIAKLKDGTEVTLKRFFAKAK